MTFLSFPFFVLLSVTFAGWNLAGARSRRFLLLLSSCVFIGFHNPVFLAVAAGVSLFSFFAAKAVARAVSKGGNAALYMWLSVGTLVLAWTGFRYAGDIVGTASPIFPLGMSFYTFQAISYIVDVCRGDQDCENDLADFLIYMLLFMKFLSGPIERAGDILPQIKAARRPDYGTLKRAVLLIYFGMLKKLAVADYLSPYVDNIFFSPDSASGIQKLVAVLLFPLQLYTDFSGYTDMATGLALLFGIRLAKNFDRPFSSVSTTEFWRRWHMSLSFWVRDYVFLPLTSVFRSLGRPGIAASLVITFVVLGVWHGAGWSFVVYGLIQGVVTAAEMKTLPLRRFLTDRLPGYVTSAIFVMRTYLVFAFSLVFFKIPDVGKAFSYLSSVSFGIRSSWKEINIGMSDHICLVAGCSLVFIFVVEHISSRMDLPGCLERMPAYVRWPLYYFLAFALLTYAKIGSDSFIYLQY